MKTTAGKCEHYAKVRLCNEQGWQVEGATFRVVGKDEDRVHLYIEEESPQPAKARVWNNGLGGRRQCRKDDNKSMGALHMEVPPYEPVEVL